MRLVPLGVRGSTPAPGAEFVKYGGHTSCVAVFADGQDVPHLILDAGTGLRDLTGLLSDAPFDGTIVLTHLHWDHIQGLPFCRAVDNSAAKVKLLVPVPETDVDAVQLLARGFSPPHFPIHPTGLEGDWQFIPIVSGQVTESISVGPVAHKGGHTVGVRVTLDGAVAAYLPDHALHTHTSVDDLIRAEALVAGADVLLHDGQFVQDEAGTAREYGHATVEQVLQFADRCNVGALVLTHHGPARTDDQLDELARRFTSTPDGRPVTFAGQGRPIDVGRRIGQI